jgi:hypothetical protein
MEDLFERVIGILRPYVGAATALASVKMFLHRARLAPTEIRLEHLPEIADTLKPGLAVFVGRARAEDLAQTIRDLVKGESD